MYHSIFTPLPSEMCNSRLGSDIYIYIYNIMWNWADFRAHGIYWSNFSCEKVLTRGNKIWKLACVLRSIGGLFHTFLYKVHVFTIMLLISKNLNSLPAIIVYYAHIYKGEITSRQSVTSLPLFNLYCKINGRLGQFLIHVAGSSLP